MAVKYLDKYKASSDAKTGGVHSEGLFHVWTPDRNKSQYNQLIAQGRAEYEKDFESVDELRAFLKTLLVGVKTNGSAPEKVTNSMLNEASEDTLYALIANASHDRYRTGKKDGTGWFFDVLHGSWVKAVRKGITEFKAFKKVVGALEEKGLSENQINQFLSNNKVSGANAEDLTEYAEKKIPEYTVADFAGENGFGVTEDLDENGEPRGLDISDAAAAEGNAPSTEDTIEQANQTILAGDATNPDDLTPVTDADGNVVDGEFTDADGKTVYLGSDGKYRYEDGEEYISPDQNTVIRDTQEAQDAAGEARDELIAATEDYGNFVDSAITSLDSAENDFAQQFTDAANEFLYGSAITPENAASKGFTLSDDGTYTGPDGRSYTVGTGNTLVDSDGNALRTDGFRDYQTQMQEANATYQSEMGTLRGEYDQAYTSYESELNPYRTQMDEITEDLRGIAEQAGDTNYYNRLSNLYYEEASDEIDRQTAGAQETLNESYANAGLDPSSPAYTQAIMDLQNKRSDASRSARRQAILDSYSLGNQMLTNQTNALSNAQAGIGRSMDALGDLYDVKLEGLGVEKDMISTMYAGKMDAAKIGMEGLNVSAGLQRDTINANQNQFYKNLDLTSGLYGSKINAANSLYGTMQNTTNTGLDRLQNYQNQQIDWRLAGASLLGTLQANDIDPSTLDLDDRTKEALGWND